MKLTEAKKALGSAKAVTDAIGITTQNWYRWKASGDTIPDTHRPVLVVASKGKLKPSPRELAAWTEQRDLLTAAIKYGSR